MPIFKNLISIEQQGFSRKNLWIQLSVIKYQNIFREQVKCVYTDFKISFDKVFLYS